MTPATDSEMVIDFFDYRSTDYFPPSLLQARPNVFDARILLVLRNCNINFVVDLDQSREFDSGATPVNSRCPVLVM